MSSKDTKIASFTDSPQVEQLNIERERFIQTWIEDADRVLETIHNWKAYLQAFQQHPNVSDDAFMAVFQDMTQNGLYAWLDGHHLNIDRLRQDVTRDWELDLD